MKNKSRHPTYDHLTTHSHDPFQILGRHDSKNQEIIRVYSPGSINVEFTKSKKPLERISGSDYFEWRGKPNTIDQHYQLSITYDNKETHTYTDPYSFLPIIPDFDLHLYSEGNHWHIYKHLGANPRVIDNIDGYLFAVWAPNARRVSVVGDFNQWDGRRHCMRSRGNSGIWELFIPNLAENELYKFEILDQHKGINLKNDPFARHFEIRPNTAAITQKPAEHQWSDEHWISQRQNNQWLHEPLSIYEVHLGSWKRDQNFEFMNYRELAHELVDYLKPLGFTHIELLPITEHPLDASWGYQSLGYFAPTSRFGSNDDFRYFVDYCHQHNIGIILDWVPAHFPTDSHGLAQFDGTLLYEHEDPRKGEHRDWGTLIYNYGRNEVKNFLIASALFWLEEYHIDGLRVDAVASMLYLDYSREADDWIPNKYGGNENLEAIEFIKELNTLTQQQYPGSLIIAEESTAWPAVSRPTWLGGLGFSMKWNMGWMHDTLNYMQKDPIHRHYHHDKLTFGMVYSFTENFVLPFSHDEVVHGKGSMIGKMPGDDWQQFANLRLLYTYMFAYPGKKLLFMGAEIAQYSEWNQDATLEWELLENKYHSGVKKLLSDLNAVYKNNSELYYFDFNSEGFQWINCNDTDQSVISFLRKHDGQAMVVVLNFTPVARFNYRLGVPNAGSWVELINSDSMFYGGSNVGNSGSIQVENTPWMDFPYSLQVNLPPLAGVILKLAT